MCATSFSGSRDYAASSIQHLEWAAGYARSDEPTAALSGNEVERLFGALDAAPGAPDIVIYNASFRTRGPLIELNPDDVERSLSVTAFGV